MITIWLLVAAANGIIEAFLFHYKKGINESFKQKMKFDIHKLFVFFRGLMLAPFIIISNEKLIFALFAVLVFSFMHDGFYYQVRNLISKGKTYPKGFLDKSTTTTAVISLSFFWRLILFLFGMGMIPVLIFV